MSKGILRQLKDLKSGEVNPRAEWMQTNRSVLLSQIKNTINPSESRQSTPKNIWEGLAIFFSPNTVNFALRPVAILLIVSLVLLTGKIATVDAAYEVLPGDLFYPAKRVVEKTQVAVVKIIGDKKTETKLHSEFAKRRASEANRMVVSGDAQKAEMVSQTLSDLKQELKSVDVKLDNPSDVTADVVREVKQNTEEIRNTLNQVKNNLIVDDGGKNLTQEVAAAKDAAKDTEMKAVQTMVDKHLQGDATVTKDEVKQVINDTLKNVVGEATESKQNAEDAKNVVEAVKTEVKDLTRNPVVGVEVASSTKALTEKISVAASEANDASVKTDALAKEVDKQALEVKALLSTDDLTEAVNKVKEAVENGKKAEQITDQSIANVQKVLPVMSVVVKDNVNTVVATSTNNIVITVSTTPVAKPILSTSTLNTNLVAPAVSSIVPSAMVSITTTPAITPPSVGSVSVNVAPAIQPAVPPEVLPVAPVINVPVKK